MAIKSFRPITPSRRYMTSIDYSVLTKTSVVPVPKSLLVNLGEAGGRNNTGRTTVRYRGSGHKRKYRLVDFARTKPGISARVEALHYDPYRTAFLALLVYADGARGYILAPEGLVVGDQVISGKDADIKPGNCLPISAIPVGTFIHNIELEAGRGGRMVRSAGSAAQLMAKEGTYAQVKMPSGEMRLIHSDCMATIGQVSNKDHENVTIGKAGRARWMGRRPHVRGCAMNPVDHPMGGGEGKATGGQPRSPWGTPSKGYKTRNSKRTDAFIVKRRK